MENFLLRFLVAYLPTIFFPMVRLLDWSSCKSTDAIVICVFSLRDSWLEAWLSSLLELTLMVGSFFWLASLLEILKLLLLRRRRGRSLSECSAMLLLFGPDCFATSGGFGAFFLKIETLLWSWDYAIKGLRAAALIMSFVFPANLLALAESSIAILSSVRLGVLTLLAGGSGLLLSNPARVAPSAKLWDRTLLARIRLNAPGLKLSPFSACSLQPCWSVKFGALLVCRLTRGNSYPKLKNFFC